ncbi:MAG: hypothetical protein ABSE73_06695 [Planctomycetota bacterium]
MKGTLAEKGEIKGGDTGHVHTTIKVENFFDWTRVQEKKRRRIRTVIIPDALVDRGTMHLCLPSRCIKELGLKRYPGTITATTAASVVERQLYGGVLLTIEDLTEECAVAELPDNAPALVGVAPLEGLDYTVDPTTQSLIGKHGKKRVMLMY